MAGPASAGKPKRFSSRDGLRDWLWKNHGSSSGFWLVIAKKHADGLHYDEAVEEALCFGWIDSTTRKLDDDHFQIWYAPRKADSFWAISNKRRVERLIAAGRITPAGQAAIDRARANGSWEALDAIENLEVPDDLRAAFRENRNARAAYDKLAPSHKKQYLYWINSAKRAETRERRLRETVSRLAQGIKPGT